MLLPLVLLLLGLWEVRRGADDHAAFEAEQQRLAGLVTQMEAAHARIAALVVVAGVVNWLWARRAFRPRA